MWMSFDTSLYADDAAAMCESRADLQADIKGMVKHFSRWGLEIHQGKAGVESKTVAMVFPKNDRQYTAAEALNGIDMTDIMIDEDAGTSVHFALEFPYLGSILDCSLDDLRDVTKRISKASGVFGRYAKRVFCNAKFSLPTKANAVPITSYQHRFVRLRKLGCHL